MNQVAARYRAMQTYQDRLHLAISVEAEDPGAADLPGMEGVEQVAALAFERPNHIALDHEMVKLYCDGIHLWTALPDYGQCTNQPAPEALGPGLDLPGEMAFGGGEVMVHPVSMLLLSHPGPFLAAMPEVESWRGVSEQTRDGRPGRRVEGTIRVEGMPGERPSRCSFWISTATGLIEELRIDATDGYNATVDMMRKQREDAGEEDAEAASPPARLKKYEALITIQDPRVDEPIPAERFAFKPGGEFEEVQEFGFPDQDELRQQELVGLPAPDFSGKDLRRADVSLADFKGRVVVLDFWATWCRPCVEAIPHMQALAERLTEEPVTVLGVNRDDPGSEKKVENFLEKKKITLRQVLDFEGKIAEQYRVTGIPCTVLIDQQGLVQEISVGFAPGSDEELASNARKLLGGGTLLDEAKLARRREAATEGQAEKKPTPDSGPEELNPDRLAEIGSLGGRFAAGYSPREVDVDGDGQHELVLSGQPGSASVISADGTRASQLRFDGVSSRAWVGVEDLVTIGGHRFWLVVETRGTMSGRSTATLGLFDLAGQAMWRYRPDLTPKTSSMLSAAAGDLDGDGTIEFVVGVRTFSPDAWEETPSSGGVQRGDLVLLDQAGAVLSSRRVGSDVEYVWIAGPEAPGGPRTIVCISEGRARRFRLEPGRKPG
jgi:peroxiredoxin